MIEGPFPSGCRENHMAFIQAAASFGLRPEEELSADNSVPERHIVVETLRRAAPFLGLNASVIATLDAMLSCLPPKRNHNTVFASNATLTFRRNGISDRTIRRHAAALQEAGLLERRDSPNRKRYTRHNTHEGKALRFGFDLSPLFARMSEISTLAAKTLRQQEEIAYLRCKIRTAANDVLLADPENQDALAAKRALRRKLSKTDCEDLLAQFSDVLAEGKIPCGKTPDDTHKLTGNDGQNVRHYHNSNKENIDRKEDQGKTAPKSPDASHPISVRELVEACPEAAQFACEKITTPQDVLSHARTLAPMIGIDSQNYQAAQDRLGPMGAAMTVWAIMQFHDRIRQVGAYFRSITTGAKSSDFDPAKLVRRLAFDHGSLPSKRASGGMFVRGQAEEMRSTAVAEAKRS